MTGGSAQFSDKNVGNAKTVVLTGYGLSGADAGNYLLSTPASLTADITPATLNISDPRVLFTINSLGPTTVTCPMVGSSVLARILAFA